MEIHTDIEDLSRSIHGWSAKLSSIQRKYLERINSIPNLLKDQDFREFGIRFTHSSNSIEGSSLDLMETSLAIDDPAALVDLKGRDPLRLRREVVEARQHMKCYLNMIETNEPLTISLIKKWHGILFEYHPQGDEFAGQIRQDVNRIAGTDFVPPRPREMKVLLKQLFKWYEDEAERYHPVLISCLMHYWFVSIHPFLDGNGRMTRLIMNFILFKNDFPMFNIPASIRESYYIALDKVRFEGGEIHFVKWFVANYILDFYNNPLFNEKNVEYLKRDFGRFRYNRKCFSLKEAKRDESFFCSS